MKRKIRTERDNILNQLKMLEGIEFDRSGEDLVVLFDGLVEPKSIKFENDTTISAKTVTNDNIIIKYKCFFNPDINDLSMKIESIKLSNRKQKLGEDFYEV